MKVSVIIPALNEERLIAKTLQSVRDQKFRGKIELIVADGKSDDKTVEISKKYCDKVVTEKNRTIAAGRQKGAQIASGEIIIFTDADSICDKNWIAEIVEAFEDKKISACYGWIIPCEGNFVEKFILKWGALLTSKFVYLFGADYVAGSNMAIRKKVFEKIGGFDVTIKTAEDTYLIQRAREVGKVIFVPKAKIYYSMRRVKGWGYFKYFYFHTTNFFNTQIFKKHAGSYDPVRED